METKDKLLKLINSCIENKAMYNSDNKEKDSISHSEHLVYDRKNIIELSSYEENKVYDVDYSTRCAYIEEMQKKISQEKQEHPATIEIKFDAEPSIFICYATKVIKKNSICDKEFLAREMVNGTRQVKNFWGITRTEAYSYKPKIFLTVWDVEYDFYATIKMGGISIDITLEEFKELSKRIIENRKRFIESKHDDILNDRIKRYCK